MSLLPHLLTLTTMPLLPHQRHIYHKAPPTSPADTPTTMPLPPHLLTPTTMPLPLHLLTPTTMPLPLHTSPADTYHNVPPTSPTTMPLPPHLSQCPSHLTYHNAPPTSPTTMPFPPHLLIAGGCLPRAGCCRNLSWEQNSRSSASPNSEPAANTNRSDSIRWAWLV